MTGAVRASLGADGTVGRVFAAWRRSARLAALPIAPLSVSGLVSVVRGRYLVDFPLCPHIHFYWCVYVTYLGSARLDSVHHGPTCDNGVAMYSLIS